MFTCILRFSISVSDAIESVLNNMSWNFLTFSHDFYRQPLYGRWLLGRGYIPNVLLNVKGKIHIITHSAGQTYVWHGCKWNFAGPQIYLQPAEIKSQHFGVSLKFLVCN